MKNFWKKLNKPIYVLAPLAGVSDSPFRRMCKEYGADLVYSEMASATALFYLQKKLEDNPTLELLKFNKKERPFVVQLFGSEPEHFAIATQIISEKIKPDGIDINFGCPAPKVAKQKAGAELFKDLKKSREVIRAVIANTDLPVSIKTRTQAGDIGLLKFLDYMKDLNIKALMIHGRTLKQGFSGPIDCEIIKNARNYFQGIILANGGIHNHFEAENALLKTKADGLGIGRGSLGRPWIFEELKNDKIIFKKTQEIFKIALKHAKLVFKEKGDGGMPEMRKHLCWYIQGLSNARKLREKLVKINNIKDIEKIFNSYLI